MLFVRGMRDVTRRDKKQMTYRIKDVGSVSRADRLFADDPCRRERKGEEKEAEGPGLHCLHPRLHLTETLFYQLHLPHNMLQIQRYTNSLNNNVDSKTPANL
jgi:hypothetical protein